MKLRPIGKVAVAPAVKKQRRLLAAAKRARLLLGLYEDLAGAKASGVTPDEMRRLYLERQAARSTGTKAGRAKAAGRRGARP